MPITAHLEQVASGTRLFNLDSVRWDTHSPGMKPARLVLPAIVLLVLTAALWWGTRSSVRRPAAISPDSIIAGKRPEPPQAPSAKGRPKAEAMVQPAITLSPGEQQREEHKKIDREHLTKIRAGIFAYKTKYGNYPEYLTQLVPEFVSGETLISPHKKADARDAADFDHQDPGLAKPSYGYEFSNLVFRDGRTFAEIKEVQRAEWGDAIPLLRCFAYGTVMNMAYGGDVYETALNWEWDAATMDLVDKYGWGPGLKVGEVVKVRVTGADGQPVPRAEVWADGRTYSFDLPNRPFTTDSDGWATIPLGADLDRTALALRAVAPGLASATVRYPAGQLPDGQSLQMTAPETVGGIALDASGQPLPNARVYLQTGGGIGNTATVTSVRTDDVGRWQAAVHPQDITALSAMIGVPTGMPVKYAPGQALDAAAARAGTAEVRAGGQP